MEGDILTLQIETHGCDEGMGLSYGELLKWKDFYDCIRPLNIKTGHLLFLVMAMCKSIAMISSINPELRAPYRAIICTTRPVSADEIYRGFIAFYENYYNLLDIIEAIKAIQKVIHLTTQKTDVRHEKTKTPASEFRNGRILLKISIRQYPEPSWRLQPFQSLQCWRR